MADLELVVAGTDELRPSVLVEIRALLDAAFDDPDNPDEAFDDDDWDHTVGGTHVLVKDDDGQVISHASVVDRIVDVGGRPLRTGYVEGVATAKAFEGQGHGSRVMSRIAEVMQGDRAPTAVQSLVRDLGGPTSLRGIGFAQADIGRAVDLAVARAYPNPREVTRAGIAALLHQALNGDAATRLSGAGDGFG